MPINTQVLFLHFLLYAVVIVYTNSSLAALLLLLVTLPVCSCKNVHFGIPVCCHSRYQNDSKYAFYSLLALFSPVETLELASIYNVCHKNMLYYLAY